MEQVLAAVGRLATESGTGEVHESATMPILPFLPELVFGIVCFGIILAIAAKMFVPAMEKAYAERRDAIEGDMSRAENALAEAEELKRQHQAQLTEARSDAARLREEAREQGASIIAEMRDQAQVEAARILENAGKQIDAERAQAMAQLKGDVGKLSTDLASRIVGESLHDETRQRGIVERFIADLEAGRVAGGPATPAGTREVDF
ncbi:MAG: F0F1 ATP synthase subunit B [Actinobacteria bacterium]|nr:F0F1 ATP synthase subunit B [Actinomycetota bacterium]